MAKQANTQTVANDLALPQRSAVTAEVNGETLTQLWEPQGRFSIMAPPDAVDAMIAAGYTRYQRDIKATAQTFLQTLAAAERAVTAFVDTVLEDGEIDASEEAELATAEIAMNTLIAQWSEIRDDAQRLYRVREADPVTVADEFGRDWQVDPGQRERYESGEGFRAMNLIPPQ